MKFKLPKIITYICCIGIVLTGCQSNFEIKSDSPSDGKYATQSGMTAVEYTQFISKEITVFVNILEGRMISIRTQDSNITDSELSLIENDIEDMQDIVDQVQVTIPSKGKENDRTAVMTAMNNGIAHMKQYKDDLKNKKSVSKYSNVFQSDFNELTSLSNTYTE